MKQFEQIYEELTQLAKDFDELDAHNEADLVRDIKDLVWFDRLNDEERRRLECVNGIEKTPEMPSM